MLKNHFLPNVLHTTLLLEDWFTGKALLGLNNKIDKKPNKLLKDYLYVRDNYKCIQKLFRHLFKKKKISFKKIDKYYLQQQSHNIKKKKTICGSMMHCQKKIESGKKYQ